MLKMVDNGKGHLRNPSTAVVPIGDTIFSLMLGPHTSVGHDGLLRLLHSSSADRRGIVLRIIWTGHDGSSPGCATIALVASSCSSCSCD